jgi:hypothetical protein
VNRGPSPNTTPPDGFVVTQANVNLYHRAERPGKTLKSIRRPL